MDDDRNFEARVREIVLEVLAEQAASVLGDPDVAPEAKSAAGQQLAKAAARKRRGEE